MAPSRFHRISSSSFALVLPFLLLLGSHLSPASASICSCKDICDKGTEFLTCLVLKSCTTLTTVTTYASSYQPGQCPACDDLYCPLYFSILSVPTTCPDFVTTCPTDCAGSQCGFVTLSASQCPSGNLPSPATIQGKCQACKTALAGSPPELCSPATPPTLAPALAPSPPPMASPPPSIAPSPLTVALSPPLPTNLTSTSPTPAPSPMNGTAPSSSRPNARAEVASLLAIASTLAIGIFHLSA